VGADAGEGSATGPVKYFDLWIFGLKASVYSLDILDLEPKVVQTGLPPGSPGIDIQPNVSVSDDRGSARLVRRRLGRSRAKKRFVKFAQQSESISDNRDMLQL
jgi:hypothetical protein